MVVVVLILLTLEGGYLAGRYLRKPQVCRTGWFFASVIRGDGEK